MGNKQKVLSQQHVSSRMNFLFQASHLMAANHQSKLAAFYGKLCRNVGTKSLSHMAPTMKRSLCRRCSLPLIPGVNTELQVAEQQEEVAAALPPQKADETSTNGEAAKTKKKRHRRLRKNRIKGVKQEQLPGKPTESQPEIPVNALFMECSLCQGRRSFPVNSLRECWVEQPQALVEKVCLPAQSNDQR